MMEHTIKKTNYAFEPVEEKVGTTDYSYQPADGVMYSKEPTEKDVKIGAYFEGMRNRFMNSDVENYYKALNDLRAELNNKAKDVHFVKPEEDTRVDGDDLADSLTDAKTVKVENASMGKNSKDVHLVGPELTDFLAKMPVIDAKKHYKAKDLHYVKPKLTAPAKIEIPTMAKPAPARKHYNVEDFHYVQPVLTLPADLKKALEKAAMQQAEAPKANAEAVTAVPQSTPVAEVKEVTSAPKTEAAQKVETAPKAEATPKTEAASATQKTAPESAEKQVLGFDENSPFWQEFVHLGKEFEKAKNGQKEKLFEKMEEREAGIYREYTRLSGIPSPSNMADREKLYKESHGVWEMWRKASEVNDCIRRDRPLPKWWQDIMAKQADAPAQQVQAPKAAQAPVRKETTEQKQAPKAAPKTAPKAPANKYGKKYAKVGCGILTGLLILASVVAAYALGSGGKKVEKNNTGKGVVIEKKVNEVKSEKTTEVKADDVKVDVKVDDGRPRALTAEEQGITLNDNRAYINNGTTIVTNGTTVISVGETEQKRPVAKSAERMKPVLPSAGDMLGNTLKGQKQSITCKEAIEVQEKTGHVGRVTKRIIDGRTVYILMDGREHI